MRVEVSRVRRCHGGDQLFRGPRGGEEESAHVLFLPLVLPGRLTRHPRSAVAKLRGQVGASQVRYMVNLRHILLH